MDFELNIILSHIESVHRLTMTQERKHNKITFLEEYSAEN